jgi:hypothetical protein
MKSDNVTTAVIVGTALLIFTATGNAAYYKGVVSDSATSAKLDSVLVSLKGTTTKTYTNTQGQFTINTPASILAPHYFVSELPVRFDAANRSIRWGEGHDVAVAVYDMKGMVVGRSGRSHNVGTYSIPRFPDGVYVMEINIDGINYREKITITGGTTILKMTFISMGTVDRMAKISAAGDTLVFSKTRYNSKTLGVTTGDTNLVVKLTAAPCAVTHGQQINSSNVGRAGAAACGIPGFSSTMTTNPGGNITGNQTFNNVHFTGWVRTGPGTITFNFCLFDYQIGQDGRVLITGGTTTCNWCDINGRQVSGDNGMAVLGSGRGILYRCEVQGAVNLWTLSSGDSASECYFHNSFWISGAHTDAIELYSVDSVRIARCRIILENTRKQSCVNCTNDFGNSQGRGLTFTNNYMCGGNAVNLVRLQGGTYMRNVKFIGNYYGDINMNGFMNNGWTDIGFVVPTTSLAAQQANPDLMYWEISPNPNKWAPNGEGVTSHTPGAVITTSW